MTRLIALVLGLALAAAAQAHTPLASSLPAADASVAAPKTVELTFGGDVRLTAVSLTDSSGAAKHLDARADGHREAVLVGRPRAARAGRVQSRLARRRRRYAHHLRRVRLHGGRCARALTGVARVLRHRCARHRPAGDRFRRVVSSGGRRAVSRALRALHGARARPTGFARRACRRAHRARRRGVPLRAHAGAHGRRLRQHVRSRPRIAAAALELGRREHRACRRTRGLALELGSGEQAQHLGCVRRRRARAACRSC